MDEGRITRRLFEARPRKELEADPERVEDFMIK